MLWTEDSHDMMSKFEWKQKNKYKLVYKKKENTCLFPLYLHRDRSCCQRRGRPGPSLSNLHVVGGEKAVGPSAHAAPPALIDHLDVGDDVTGVKGDLVVSGWNREINFEQHRNLYH